MTINFNVPPYYDDYNENDNYYKILFRPGTAVQARELTQLQTMLQKQIERFGKNLYTEGAMVIPGQISIQTNVDAVKLTGTIIPSQWENKTIKGVTSQVTAKVLKAINVEGTDKATLIVNFTSAGTNNTNNFNSNENLFVVTNPTVTTTTAASDVITKSSIAEIKRGVYFCQGYFVLVERQIIALDKYGNTPSYKIGLSVSQDLVTPEDDANLNDNAGGTYNSNAPGAHRFKFELILDKIELSSEADQDFIELARIENGILTKLINRTQFAELEKTLARRTFDESGNYCILPFEAKIQESRNNNRGTWVSGMRDVQLGDIVSYNGKYFESTSSGSLTTGSTPPTSSGGTVSDGTVTWALVRSPKFNSGVYTPEQGGKEEEYILKLSPGKAYVQGYEIEKVTESYTRVRKPRRTAYVTGENIPAPIGNYTLGTVIFNAPDITNFQLVQLYSKQSANIANNTGTGDIVGNARVRDIIFDKYDTLTSNNVFKISLFDIKMKANKSFTRDVKQISAGNSFFNARIFPNLSYLEGQVSGSGTTTLTGENTLFDLELKVGDYIFIENGSQTRRITAITNNYTLTVDASITVTGSRYYLITASLQETNFSTLLFPTQNDFLKNTLSTSYVVSSLFSETSNPSGELQISGGTYPTNALKTDFVFVNKSTGNTLPASCVNITSSVINLYGLEPSTRYAIIYPEQKSNVTEKTKTRTFITKTISNREELLKTEISLEKCDIINVESIFMESTPGNQDYSVNVLEWFNLDNGQRDSHYDVGKLIRKNTYPAPSGNLKVYYSYFAHGAGDYFSVNSYAGIKYEKIPSYKNVFLGSVFDFRPRKNNTGVNFTGTDSSLTKIPRRNFNLTSGYNYYLSRTDKVIIDTRGDTIIKQGVDSTDRPIPDNTEGAMTLYKIEYAPYGVSLNSPFINVIPIEYKRYTMRDIAALEQRLKTVEYYTSLNLLEQSTTSLQITDAVTGLNRFKNGFAVENITELGPILGDQASEEYKCSTENNNIIMPSFTVEYVNLIEETPNDRISNGYKKSDSVITLPYTEQEFIVQPHASKYEFIRTVPGRINNIGYIKLVPESDLWFDVTSLPEIRQIQNVGRADRQAQILVNRSIGKTPEDEDFIGISTTFSYGAWVGNYYTLGTTNERLYNVSFNGNNSSFTPSYKLVVNDIARNRATLTTTKTASIIERFSDPVLVGDRLISNTVAQYMRPIPILFLGKAMQPMTKLNAFFARIDVNSFVNAASRISVNGTTLTLGAGSADFDDNTNHEEYNSDDFVRVSIPGTWATSPVTTQNARAPLAAYNQGDRLFVWKRPSIPSSLTTPYIISNSPCTAVLALKENSVTGNIFHVVNVKKGENTSVPLEGQTFIAGDIIKGDPSGATITVSQNIVHYGNTLITNIQGDIAGIFDLPGGASSPLKFSAKEARRFTLTDSTQDLDYNAFTRAVGYFTSTGRLIEKASVVRSIKSVARVEQTISTPGLVTLTNESDGLTFTERLGFTGEQIKTARYVWTDPITDDVRTTTSPPPSFSLEGMWDPQSQ